MSKELLPLEPVFQENLKETGQDCVPLRHSQ